MNETSKRPKRSEYGKHWALDRKTVFLNHGSFGACPTEVLGEQSRLRDRLEADPPLFFFEEAPRLWAAAIESLSTFIHADPAGMAFQVNATAGVNTVLRSLDFNRGDEILVPDHAYRACRNAIDYVCRRWGAKPVRVHVPFQAEESGILERMISAVSPRSRLAMIDTVCSPTAVRMPFEKLTMELQSRGVDVLVDGAHGVGLIPLDLDALDAAYFTGNCHKWLCTPKGSGFLHVREDRRNLVHPLTVSHGYSAAVNPNERFRMEFDWQGTQDPTPWLCIPKAIDFIDGLIDDGWPAVMARNHELALHARRVLCEALNTDAATPEAMVTAMVSLAIPPNIGALERGFEADPLIGELYRNSGIEIAAVPWPAHHNRYLRVSAALYNSKQEYSFLADTLRRPFF